MSVTPALPLCPPARVFTTGIGVLFLLLVLVCSFYYWYWYVIFTTGILECCYCWQLLILFPPEKPGVGSTLPATCHHDLSSCPHSAARIFVSTRSTGQVRGTPYHVVASWVGRQHLAPGLNPFKLVVDFRNAVVCYFRNVTSCCLLLCLSPPSSVGGRFCTPANLACHYVTRQQQSGGGVCQACMHV